MLYRFQSHATPDLLMLEPVGRQVLKLWGKAPEQPGILRAAVMPQATPPLPRPPGCQNSASVKSTMHRMARLRLGGRAR